MIRVGAPRVGDGPAVMKLWRQLWDLHESWGSYPGTRDPAVYEALAERVNTEARLRDGSPVLDKHVHLLAFEGERVIGQVEGWVDAHGLLRSTPTTCEVRSLVVQEAHQGKGVGRHLMRELARVAKEVAGRPVFLAAEVFDANPARDFYDRLGYTYVARTARLSLKHLRREDLTASTKPHARVRAAEGCDALPLALFDQILARRRLQAGDLRFDRERAVEASMLSAIASYVVATRKTPTEFVRAKDDGSVLGAATLGTMQLDPPFRSGVRAVLARVSVDATESIRDSVTDLIKTCAVYARERGASELEITDLPPSPSPLMDAVLFNGAETWSHVAGKLV